MPLTSNKPPVEERSLITGQLGKRPYGTRAHVQLQSAALIGHTEGVCLLFHSGAFVTIEPRQKAPWEGGDKFAFTLEGFPTAAAAEAGGRRLVQSLLWTAVSMNFALRLEYNTYEPTAVFDRTRSGGIRSEGYMTVGWPLGRVLDELYESYAAPEDPDPSTLLSMEIFAGARLEISQRARFLAIVSALEPLADAQSLGPAVTQFVERCVVQLEGDCAIADSVRASLRGQLHHLRTESIRQSILRVVRGALPDNSAAPELIDEAYAIRSQVVHEGRPRDLDLDLEHFGRRVSDVLREIYAARLGRSLKTAATAG